MLPIKVYFNDEIRRFQFDAPKSGPIYSALVQKLHLMYSDFPLADVDLCWNDSDGDLVVFRSDDELKEAMRNINDGVFRLVIKSKNPKVSHRGCNYKTPACDVSGPVHKGVICDGCDMIGIVGIRYKCFVCPDYDLCEYCLNDNVHDQHPFIRITRPDDRSWEDVWVFNGPPDSLSVRLWERLRINMAENNIDKPHEMTGSIAYSPLGYKKMENFGVELKAIEDVMSIMIDSKTCCSPPPRPPPPPRTVKDRTEI